MTDHYWQTSRGFAAQIPVYEGGHTEVHIVESDETSGGATQPGTSPMGLVAANALFAAAGRRLRRLPLEVG